MTGEWGFWRRALLVVGGSTGASALLAVLLLVLPKFIDISTFGYVQLYLFYVTYLSYLSLGISDGLFIRFSGTPMSEIPPEVVSVHVRFLASTLMCLAPIALLFIGVESSGPQTLVLSVAVLSTSAYLLRSLLTFLYQAAGDAKLFARSTVLERLLWVALALALLASGYRGLGLFLWTDLVARLVGLGFCMRAAWPQISARTPNWRASLHEIQLSLRVGVFVSAAAVATVLVPAVGRFAAERGFGIEVFAELSLAFSLQSIVLSVVGPIGLVVLPSLKRQSASMPAVYRRAATSIGPPLLVSVLLYFPIVMGMRYWLPEYRLLPIFLAFIFPMIVFESRTRILAIPFMQALNRERALMTVNLGCLALAGVLSYVAVWRLNNVTALAFFLFLVVTLRGLLLEKMVERHLSEPRWRSTVLELVAIGTFLAVATHPVTPGWWIVAVLVWLTYLAQQRAPIASLLRRLAS